MWCVFHYMTLPKTRAEVCEWTSSGWNRRTGSECADRNRGAFCGSKGGCFYGPKIDVQIWSAIGRGSLLATNQVDFAQSRSFNLAFTNRIMRRNCHWLFTGRHWYAWKIHWVPAGHYAGKFPLWLAPVQVKVLPIGDKFWIMQMLFLKLKKKYSQWGGWPEWKIGKENTGYWTNESTLYWWWEKRKWMKKVAVRIQERRCRGEINRWVYCFKN